MSYESYRLSHSSLYSTCDPHELMKRDKVSQVRFLYEGAADRENNCLLNGRAFIQSPRIFDRKFVDSIHHKITVETLADSDILECGDELEYDSMHWLCLNSYCFHGLYYKATFMSCDWQIYWMNAGGEIKSKYVIDQNSTQYNSGESGTVVMTIGAAQHMLKMQCDDDTVMFDDPMRFVIDRNIKKPTCYKVTQNDNSAYNYGKGLCCVTVTQAQLNLSTDKLITLPEGKQVWICDYKETNTTTPLSPTAPPILSATISGDTSIKLDFPRTYTVDFSDCEGNKIVDVPYEWKIESDFKNLIDITQNQNKITLFVNDRSLIKQRFHLQIIVENKVLGDKEIIISDIY